MTYRRVAIIIGKIKTRSEKRFAIGMIKKMLGCVREYKKPTILTLIFIVLEAVIECFIPFITAYLVNRIQTGTDLAVILWIGLLLVVMAALSLTCGGIAGVTSARASSGSLVKGLSTKTGFPASSAALVTS